MRPASSSNDRSRHRAASSYDDDVIKGIRRLTGGNPFFIQQLCQYCIELLNRRKDGLQGAEGPPRCGPEAGTSTWQRCHHRGTFWAGVGGAGPTHPCVRSQKLSPRGPALSVASRDLFEHVRHAGLKKSDISSSITRLSALPISSSNASSEASREIRYRHSVDLMRLWVLRQPKIDEARSSCWR